MKIEIMLPCLVLFLMIVSSIIITYMIPQGSWVIVYYPFSNEHPLMKVASEVDYIASISEEKRTATVYISSTHQKNTLEKQGAILIDPEGIPLCQRY